MFRNGKLSFAISRLASTLREVERSVPFQSTDRLGVRMKQLNDAKRFKESLSLFDDRDRSKTSDLAINQALKASIHSGQFQRGLLIHKQLPSRSFNCRHIQMSLVQLYSESFLSFREGEEERLQLILLSANRRCHCCSTDLLIGANESTNSVLVHGHAQWSVLVSFPSLLTL